MSISCSSDVKKEDELIDFGLDTIFSKGNEILFLIPSEKFLLKVENSKRKYKKDSEFKYYANDVLKDINEGMRWLITAKYTQARFLGVISNNDTIFIDRYKDSLYYGTLFNFKEGKYKIDRDVFTDKDFLKNFEILDNKEDSTQTSIKIDF